MPRSFLVALVLVAGLQAGCRPPAEPYNADVAIVHMLGRDEGLDKLRTVLKQAAAPQVTPQSVDVTTEYYFYQALDIAMYGRGFVSKKVYFKEVERVEMWESRGHTYVRLMAGDKKVDQLKWGSSVDAKLFADLVMSFKANPNIGDDESPRKRKKKAPEDEETEEKEAPPDDTKGA
ncbi:MAG: hypothetical protein HOV80_12890 [Polyangiaceae bacterium]|nr:hypothetical protein [Polyangiaceae bacterium]